jgi:hypothetical protein
MAYIFRKGSIIKIRKGFENADGTFNEKRIGKYLARFKDPVNELNDSYREKDPVNNREFICGTLCVPSNPRDRGMIMGLLSDEVDNSQLASGDFDDSNLNFGRFRKRASSPKAKPQFEKERKALAKQDKAIAKFERESRKVSLMVK